MKKAILNLSQVVGILLMALPLSGGCAHVRGSGSVSAPQSAYQIALRGGSCENFKPQIDNLSNINLHNLGEPDILYAAVKGGNKDIVSCILTKIKEKKLHFQNDKNELKGSKEHYTSLGFAIIEGKQEIAKLLIQDPCINVTVAADSKSRTPIQLAAKYKRYYIFKSLLSKLQEVYENDNNKLREYLMQEIATKGKSKTTILHIAAQPVAKYTGNLATKFDRHALSPEAMIKKVLTDLEKIITPQDFRTFQSSLLSDPKKNQKILEAISEFHDYSFTGTQLAIGWH